MNFWICFLLIRAGYPFNSFFFFFFLGILPIIFIWSYRGSFNFLLVVIFNIYSYSSNLMHCLTDSLGCICNLSTLVISLAIEHSLYFCVITPHSTNRKFWIHKITGNYVALIKEYPLIQNSHCSC